MLMGKGSASRYSDTLSQKTVYYALRLSDGSVLRASDTQYSVWMMVLQALQPVVLMLLLAFGLSLWLAGRVARRLVAPINAIDLADPRRGSRPMRSFRPCCPRSAVKTGRSRARCGIWPGGRRSSPPSQRT